MINKLKLKFDWKMILENFQLLLLQDAVGSIRQKRPLDLVKAEKNREMDPIMVDPVS